MREYEKERLTGEDLIEVPVLDPKLKEIKLIMRQWNMIKQAGGKTSASYVFIKKVEASSGGT